MIRNLNKKQKIILSIIVIIIGSAVIYYTYSNERNTNETSYQDLQVENNIESEESTEENEEQETIKVHVSGAVNQEGVVELPRNSRVGDAIEKAGGVTDNAYMKDVNLAQPLEDGEKVYIPTKEEIKTEVNNNEKVETPKESSKTVNTKQETNTKKAEKVNINTADISELDTLPGIGASTANKILEYRKEKGKFNKKEDIKNVSGIGESKYNNIKDLITI